jgi:uncharacterized protein YdaU (DUF1376 family)
MNYYQHHIGDFIRDTARLTDSQCMAYLRMIWIYYETEEPLECDASAIAFKIGANASDVHQLLKHFFFQHDGKWHNSRCDKEILEFRSKSDKAKKSANARWSNANAMRTHSERNANEPVLDANQEPVTSISTTTVVDNGKKPAKRQSQMPDDFYPNETGLRYASERGIAVAEELQSLRNWAESKRVVRADWQATWRTWCDNAVKFGRGGGSRQNNQPFQTQRDLNNSAIARSLGLIPKKAIDINVIEGDFNEAPTLRLG